MVIDVSYQEYLSTVSVVHVPTIHLICLHNIVLWLLYVATQGKL